MTNITFSDNTTATIRTQHELSSSDLRDLKAFAESRVKFMEILEALKTLGHLSEGAKQPDLEHWVATEIDILTELIGELKAKPVKTFVSFVYNDGCIKAMSSISHEDAVAGRHSRKLGRVAAFKNLIKKLSDPQSSTGKVLNKKQREELAKALVPEART